MTDKPHDHFFRYVFSDVSVVQDFVKYLVSDLAEKIDLGSFEKDDTSYISSELQDFYSDIVYNVHTNTGKQVKIAFLLEHKSSPPEFPHVQINEYRQGIWRNDIANFNKKKEGDAPKRTPRKLTHVIPIIFYHGRKKWRKKPFKDYFSEIDDTFSPYIPVFDYYLVDLNEYSDEFVLALKAGFLVNSLLVFKHKGDTSYVREHSNRIFVNLKHLKADERTQQFIFTLSVYIVNTTQLAASEVIELSEKLPKEVKKDFMTAYDNILLEGEKIGLKKGTQRTNEKKTLEFAIKSILKGLSDELILDLCEIPEKTLLLLKKAISEAYANPETQHAVALHLIKEYKNLYDEDIAAFSKLTIERVQALKNTVEKS